MTGLDDDALRDALREATASQILVGDADGHATASATRCCARWCTTTCCRASAPAATPALARALEERIAARRRGRAHHRPGGAPLDGGGRPARRARGGRARRRRPRSAWTPTPRRTRCSSARSGCGTAWTTPRRSPGCGRRDLLMRAANAADLGGETAALRGAPARARSSWSTTSAEPRRGRLGARPSSTARSGSLNRQDESIETLDRALALLDPCEDTGERAELLARKARAAHAAGPQPRGDRGRPRGARGGARGRRPRRRDAGAELRSGWRCAAAREVEEGVATLREALALVRRARACPTRSGARPSTSPTCCTSSGRSEEALEVAREGRDEVLAGRALRHVVTLLVAEIEFDLRRLARRRRRDAGRAAPLLGLHAAQPPRAPDRAGARPGRRTPPRARTSTWPSGSARGLDRAAVPGPARRLPRRARAPRRRRGGRPRRGRRGARPDRVLLRRPGPDRRWRSPGCGWRPTRPQRARDRRDADAERIARERAADDGRARRAWRRPTADRWSKAASALSARPSSPAPRGATTRRCGSAPPPPGTALGRPYRAAYARWREAEARGAGARPRGRRAGRGRCARERPPARQRLARGRARGAGRAGAAARSTARSPRPPAPRTTTRSG